MRLAHIDEEQPEIQMAPLIDIIFLLLIFFLVATNFVRKEVDQQVKLPETGENKVSLKESGPTFVVNVREDGSLIVNGKLTNESELKTVAREWVVENSITGKTSFELRGDGRVPYEKIMRVMTICEEAGLKEVGLTRIAEK